MSATAPWSNTSRRSSTREAPDADPAKFYISPQVDRSVRLHGPTEWTWTTDFWRDRIHPDDAEAVVAADERSNETLEAYTLDYRFRHRDGHWVWVRDEATFVPELGRRGVLAGVHARHHRTQARPRTSSGRPS